MSNPAYLDVTFTNLCGAVGAAVTSHEGRVVSAYALTPCCGTQAKYETDSPTGVVCCACYSPVSAPYGGNGWLGLRQAARDAKCSDPDACADHILHMVMTELQPEEA